MSDILMVPYTDKQIGVIVVICILIGFIFGAMAVAVFKSDKESRY